MIISSQYVPEKHQQAFYDIVRETGGHFMNDWKGGYAEVAFDDSVSFRKFNGEWSRFKYGEIVEKRSDGKIQVFLRKFKQFFR